MGYIPGLGDIEISRIMEQFTSTCLEYGVEAIPIKPEDAWYNIVVLCKDGILVFVEDMGISERIQTLACLDRSSADAKDSGFVIFNENGMPKEWKERD